MTATLPKRFFSPASTTSPQIFGDAVHISRVDPRDLVVHPDVPREDDAHLIPWVAETTFAGHRSPRRLAARTLAKGTITRASCLAAGATPRLKASLASGSVGRWIARATRSFLNLRSSHR